MAITLTGTNYLTRPASFDPTQDWTLAFWFQIPVSFGAGYSPAKVYGDGSYTNPYIYIGTLNGTDDICLEIFDGVTYFDTAGYTITPGTWYYVVAQYNSTTHVATLYIATKTGAFTNVGSITCDIGAITFVETDEYFLNDLIGFGGNHNYGEYDRVWQSLPTLTQLAAEKISTTPVLTTGMLANTRLAYGDILTDTIGSNDWTVNTNYGYQDGPLPPSNTTPATAIDITGLLPYSITLDVQDAPEDTLYPNPNGFREWQEVWFKYTAPAAGTINLGYGANATWNYYPIPQIWLETSPGVLTALYGTATSVSAVSGYNYLPYALETGGTYYIQITNSITNLPGTLLADLQINIPVVPTGGSTGDLLVTNDNVNYPAAVLSQSTGATVGIAGLPACEQAFTLANGLTLYAKEFNAALSFVESFDLYNLYTKVLSITSIVIFHQHSVCPITSNWSDNFYVSVTNRVLAAIIYRMTTAGVIGSNWTLPAASKDISGMAVSRDDAILYWVTEVVSDPIRRYDLVNNVALSNLVAGAAFTQYGRDVMVTASGDILLTVCPNVNATTWHVKRYDSTGALQATYNIGANGASTPRIRLSFDSTYFWAMTFIASPLPRRSIFQKIRISDGTVLTTFTVLESSVTNTSPTYSPAQSCPLLILGTVANPDSGIYQIVPSKRNDTYYGTGVVKIPDPFIKTGLFGG